jgi:hypothetical protein
MGKFRAQAVRYAFAANAATTGTKVDGLVAVFLASSELFFAVCPFFLSFCCRTCCLLLICVTYLFPVFAANAATNG